MPLLDTRTGHVEYLVRGAGRPVTVFGHGLGATIAETRTLASGVLGTVAFLAFRGHGGSSSSPEPWTYRGLAGELAAVARQVGATRALGVSMGAGALCALLADQPDRFERVVFFLPAVLDRPRSDGAMIRLAALAKRAEERDLPGLVALLRDEQPAGVLEQPGAADWVLARARKLLGMDIAGAVRALPDQVAVPDRSALRAVAVPALVVGQEGDDVHPASVAEELAAVLPRATLHVFREPGAMWLARGRLRELVAGFLNG